MPAGRQRLRPSPSTSNDRQLMMMNTTTAHRKWNEVQRRTDRLSSAVITINMLLYLHDTNLFHQQANRCRQLRLRPSGNKALRTSIQLELRRSTVSLRLKVSKFHRLTFCFSFQEPSSLEQVSWKVNYRCKLHHNLSTLNAYRLFD